MSNVKRSYSTDSDEPSYVPVALAMVSFVFFLMELAARYVGQVSDGSSPMGLEPFVLLAVSLVATALALRSHFRKRRFSRARAEYRPRIVPSGH